MDKQLRDLLNFNISPYAASVIFLWMLSIFSQAGWRTNLISFSLFWHRHLGFWKSVNYIKHFLLNSTSFKSPWICGDKGQEAQKNWHTVHCETLLGSINPRKAPFCSTGTLLKRFILSLSPSLFLTSFISNVLFFFQIHSFCFLFHNYYMTIAFFIKLFSIGLIHPLSYLPEFIVSGDWNT